MPRAAEKDPMRELIRAHERIRAGDEDAAQCADAALLAAYFEHKLAADEAPRWEKHFAGCARCRAELAALARIENGGGSHAPAPWWKARWVAEVAVAAAAVIAVVVAVDQRLGRESAEQIAMAQRAQVRIVPEAAPAPAAKAESRAADDVIARDEMRQSLQAERKARIARESESHQNANALSAYGVAGLRKEQKSQREPAQEAAGSSAPMAAAPAFPATTRQMAQSESGASANAPGATLGGTLKTAPQSSSVAQNPEVTAGLPGASAVAVASPDHSVVWMIGAHGAISRYTAAGKWSAQASNVTSDLTAGSAVSRSVCWVVGRDGTVLRTVDGVHWEKIAAPTGADIVAVSSGSANEATVTTGDHREYTTSDGGKTWRPR